MTSHGWRIGDRVSLCPGGRERQRVEGIVKGLDEPGRPLGVRVQFDHPFNGADDCYATHDELTLIQRAITG